MAAIPLCHPWLSKTKLCEGKGIQAGNTGFVLKAWVPFPRAVLRTPFAGDDTEF